VTLYRINDTSKGGERVLTVNEILGLELMLGAGALVPVEPDYEAAHLSLYDSTKWHQPLADAIDAALRVGGETP